jgi:hypothetical protein
MLEILKCSTSACCQWVTASYHPAIADAARVTEYYRKFSRWRQYPLFGTACSRETIEDFFHVVDKGLIIYNFTLSA